MYKRPIVSSYSVRIKRGLTIPGGRKMRIRTWVFHCWNMMYVCDIDGRTYSFSGVRIFGIEVLRDALLKVPCGFDNRCWPGAV